MRKFLLILLGVAIIGAALFTLARTNDVKPFLTKIENINANGVLGAAAVAAAATVSDNGIVSVGDLSADYATSSSAEEKVHILIVPGHEPNYGGAEFDSQYGTIYERNMTVELGQDLQKFLGSNSKYTVDITRNTQAWSPVFASYFQNDWDAINTWVNASRKNSLSLPALSMPVPVIHISDPVNVAMRLYGITKWSNENGVDLMIHIHFNDYPGHASSIAGKYSGLVMYIPAKQYANGSTTAAVARTVFRRLTLYNPTSNLKVESSGLIDDPELIAIGANNTSDAASMLIEYEYIYEPQLVNPKVRNLALRDYAYQTYLGIEDYFRKTVAADAKDEYNPSILYSWNNPGTNKTSDPRDIYALQTALILDGDYPPVGKTRNDCPHSGTFGACTNLALAAFQKKDNITDESGIVGKKSFNILQSIYVGNQ